MPFQAAAADGTGPFRTHQGPGFLLYDVPENVLNSVRMAQNCKTSSILGLLVVHVPFFSTDIITLPFYGYALNFSGSFVGPQR